MTRNELIEHMIKNSKAIVKQVNSELDKVYTKDLNKIIRKAIDGFYSSYRPKYYRRKYSLKYMYKVTSKNGFIDMDFSGEYSNAHHRLGNEAIFDLVFIGGWHGGAPSIDENKVAKWGEHPEEGVPYWRTPPFSWEDDEGIVHPPYTEWGYRAKNDYSPMERIDDALKDYEDKISSIQDNVLKKEFKKWIH